jgi:methionine-rich copper-binding protein CopC
MTRVIRLIATTLAILGVFLTLSAAPVVAHSSQAGSTPEEGEVLATAPTLVEVRFDSPLLDIGAAMVVRTADGTSVVIGAPRVERQRISVDVDPAAPPGEYSVAYRVVAEDGHALESSFAYTIAGAESATAAESPVTPAPSPATPAAASEPASEPASVPPFLLIAGGVLVLLLAGAGAIALRR